MPVVFNLWDIAYSIIKEHRLAPEPPGSKTLCRLAAPVRAPPPGPVSPVSGGGEGIRTPDPMVANHVLCQLSYTPEAMSNLKFEISNLRFQRGGPG